MEIAGQASLKGRAEGFAAASLIAEGMALADPKGQSWREKVDVCCCVPLDRGLGGLESCLLLTDNLNLGTILV